MTLSAISSSRPRQSRTYGEPRWDPNAVRHYDVMSDGFHWSDEMPTGAIDACFRGGSWAFRYVLAYRASLIRGEPDQDFQPPWDQLLRECPDWPGFRPERNSPELWRELDRIYRRDCRLLERMMRKCEQKPPDETEARG
jgi:hypothetical protein